MSKNSAVHQKMFEHAVRKLLKHHGLSVPKRSRGHDFGSIFEEGCRQQNRAPGGKVTSRPSTSGLAWYPNCWWVGAFDGSGD
jgi:hypothetical protein